MPPAGEDPDSGTNPADRTDEIDPPDRSATDPPGEPGSAGTPSENPDTPPSESPGTTPDDGEKADDGFVFGSGEDRDPAGRKRVARPDASREYGPVEWFLKSDDATPTFVREFLGSVLVVVVIGMVLFAVSGVWPPMVAVKSGSMEPHMSRGDLVFVMEETRFAPAAAVGGSGVATHESGVETGYRRFGDHGDVIVYRKNGETGSTPIIHRARFWVNDSENWYDKANRSFVNGNSCDAIANCPAPHAGFITKGDANAHYDQISGISEPVQPDWIKGTAELRIPWLGHIRLELSNLGQIPGSQVSSGPVAERVAPA